MSASFTAGKAGVPPDAATDAAGLRLSIHDSIHLIHRKDWEAVAKEASIYLRYDHLSALEDAMAQAMGFRYALFHDERYQPVGIACFQVLDFEDNGSAKAEALCKLGNGLGARIRRDMKVRSLVCGNVFHCGDHGAHFLPVVSRAGQFLALEMAMEQIRVDERLQPRVSALMFKELWPGQREDAEVLLSKGYHTLATDVNMVLGIDPAWKDLDGYQAALTSKARTRIKSILRRSAALEIQELPAAAIRSAAPDLQRLFDGVLAQSPFIFGRLNVGVYAQWKEHLGDGMMFQGYTLNGELVGFSAAFVVDDMLDAQFVGIDYARNQQHAIYLRMLVDLLRFAMKNKLRRINFGRTAEQAKSTIGARPVPMGVLVKHSNRVANRLIGPFLRKVRPAAFEDRSPFRR
ncbi:MAG: GNAT family N-acetyltransferase [Flavobacteriales bacterium]|nr:GNAT family N-acetyltransferase [Flavobacteriales bacterium]